MHFPEADLERGSGQVDIHPGMFEDILDGDALVCWLEDPCDQVLCLLADAFQFGD